MKAVTDDREGMNARTLPRWHCLKLAYTAEGELNAEKELREGKAQLS